MQTAGSHGACMSQLLASVKLERPVAAVQATGASVSPVHNGADEMFVGQCPNIEVTMEGIRLKGLLDTGSQVTLMQQSFFDEYFSPAKLGKKTSLL